jgi:hypothetical protein
LTVDRLRWEAMVESTVDRRRWEVMVDSDQYRWKDDLSMGANLAVARSVGSAPSVAMVDCQHWESTVALRVDSYLEPPAPPNEGRAPPIEGLPRATPRCARRTSAFPIDGARD